MFANRRIPRRFVAAGLAALVGLMILWAGGAHEEASPAAAGAVSALIGPVAGDSDLVVEWVVHGQLPTAGAAVVPGPVTAVESPEKVPGSANGPGASDAAYPLVGALGWRTGSPAYPPEHPGAREGRLREGRTPALREGEPPAGWISDRTLRTIIGRKQGSLEACYHGAQALDPTLEGGVTFALTVKLAGDVEVEVLDRSPALDQAGVTGCIREKLESLDFTATPPQGGELHLRLPMNFLQVPEPAPDEDA